MNRISRDLPELRIGLPVSPDAPESGPYVVAVLDSLHRAEFDELLSEPVRGGFRQTTDLRQRGQP